MNKINSIEEEIDFKAVVKTPIRWFGLVYPYFILIFLIAGAFWLWSFNNIWSNKVPPAFTDSTRVFRDLESPELVNEAGVEVYHIPIALAINKLDEKNAASAEFNEAKIDFIESHKDEEGAKIFDAISCEPNRTLNLFSSSATWKENFDSFLKTLSSNTTRGIKPKALKLTKNELLVFYNFMLKLYQ